MVSSTVGSLTTTGWNRRSSAASFSMYFRYSSSVVAPIVWSSPRASIGFSMFDASIDPSAAPAPTTVCSSSMNRTISTLGLRHFVEDRLEPIFELAAVLRPGDERAHVERDDLLVLEPFGHVFLDDAPGESFDDGRLADAGLADEHRIVLRAAREHLDDAANLFVAPDDRIELAAARELRQVATVLLERLVFGFGILIGDALRSSHLREYFENPILRDSVLLENARRRAAPTLADDAEQQMFGADELVLQPLGFAFGGVGDFSQAWRERRLRSAVRGRLLRQLGSQLIGHGLRLDSHLSQQGRHDAVSLFHERQQQMLGLDLGVVALLREPLCRQNRFLRLFRVLVQVHIVVQVRLKADNGQRRTVVATLMSAPCLCSVIRSSFPLRGRALAARQFRERLVMRRALRGSTAAEVPLRPWHTGRQIRRACRRSACPLPFRRKTCPFWVPGGMRSRIGLPPGFGTSASPPSTAVVTGTRTFACKSCPFRSNRESGVMWMRRYRSPERRRRHLARLRPRRGRASLLPRPAGILTSTLRDWPSCCIDRRRVAPLYASSSDKSNGCSTSRPWRGLDRARSRAPATAAHLRLAAAGEKCVEEIGERIFVAEEVAHFFRRHGAIAALSAPSAAEVGVPLAGIESSGAGSAAAALRLLVHLPVRAELVVFLALLGVADDLVRLVDFLEAAFGGFVPGIDVGMILARHLSEGLLHLFGGGGFGNAERCVIVLEVHRVSPQAPSCCKDSA